MCSQSQGQLVGGLRDGGDGEGEAQAASMDQERDRRKCPFHKEVQEEQSIWGLSQRSGGNREKGSYSGPSIPPSAFKQMTGTLDLFGLRRNQRPRYKSPLGSHRS